MRNFTIHEFFGASALDFYAQSDFPFKSVVNITNLNIINKIKKATDFLQFENVIFVLLQNSSFFSGAIDTKTLNVFLFVI